MDKPCSKFRLLVTGAAGGIGRAATRALVARGHSVRGLDRSANCPPWIDDFVCTDLNDRDAVHAATEGVDMVIHIAAIPGHAAFDPLLESNIAGTYSVFEAARAHAVQRLITVSSSQLVFGHDQTESLIAVSAPYAPLNLYAVSKIYMEGLAEMYARTHGMQLLVIRPGWMPVTQEDFEAIGTTERRRNMYLSHKDTGRIFVRSVETTALVSGEVATIFAQSKPTSPGVGLDRVSAEQLLGYEAQDIYPDGCDFSDMPGHTSINHL